MQRATAQAWVPAAWLPVTCSTRAPHFKQESANA